MKRFKRNRGIKYEQNTEAGFLTEEEKIDWSWRDSSEESRLNWSCKYIISRLGFLHLLVYFLRLLSTILHIFLFTDFQLTNVKIQCTLIYSYRFMSKITEQDFSLND